MFFRMFVYECVLGPCSVHVWGVWRLSLTYYHCDCDEKVYYWHTAFQHPRKLHSVSLQSLYLAPPQPPYSSTPSPSFTPYVRYMKWTLTMLTSLCCQQETVGVLSHQYHHQMATQPQACHDRSDALSSLPGLRH